jgi:hypothetical protein
MLPVRRLRESVIESRMRRPGYRSGFTNARPEFYFSLRRFPEPDTGPSLLEDRLHFGTGEGNRWSRTGQRWLQGRCRVRANPIVLNPEPEERFEAFKFLASRDWGKSPLLPAFTDFISRQRYDQSVRELFLEFVREKPVLA